MVHSCTLSPKHTARTVESTFHANSFTPPACSIFSFDNRKSNSPCLSPFLSKKMTSLFSSMRLIPAIIFPEGLQLSGPSKKSTGSLTLSSVPSRENTRISLLSPSSTALTATNSPSPLHEILTPKSSNPLNHPSSTFSGIVGSFSALALFPRNCVSFFPHPTLTCLLNSLSSTLSAVSETTSNSLDMNTAFPSPVIRRSNSSSGLHLAALSPASTDPTISRGSSPGRGSSRTMTRSPPARTRQITLVSAK